MKIFELNLIPIYLLGLKDNKKFYVLNPHILFTNFSVYETIKHLMCDQYSGKFEKKSFIFRLQFKTIISLFNSKT